MYIFTSNRGYKCKCNCLWKSLHLGLWNTSVYICVYSSFCPIVSFCLVLLVVLIVVLNIIHYTYISGRNIHECLRRLLVRGFTQRTPCGFTTITCSCGCISINPIAVFQVFLNSTSSSYPFVYHMHSTA